MFGFLMMIGVVLTLGTLFLARMTKLNGREQRRLREDARIHNAIEHFRRDVSRAGRISNPVEHDPGRLVLYGEEGVIVYEWSAPDLTRTRQPLEGTAESFEWTWEEATPAFLIEQIGARSQVVWLTFRSTRWDPDTRRSPAMISVAVEPAGGSR